MDSHADHKGARTDKDQKAGPRRDYSIIRGTLFVDALRPVATAGGGAQDLSPRDIKLRTDIAGGRSSESVKLKGLLVFDDCQCYFCWSFLVIFQSLGATRCEKVELSATNCV
jgi:hypothetical protein